MRRMCVRVSKKPEERRQEIIDVAQRHFIEKGYEATQIKDIVSEMSVAQGLFYYYFKSKDEVFAAVSESYANALLKKITETIEKKTTSLEQLYGIVDAFAEIADSNRQVVAQMNTVGDGVFLKKIIEILRYLLVPKVTEIVAKGVMKGEFDCEYVDEISAIISFGIFQFLENYYRDVTDKDVKKISIICKTVIKRNFSAIS